MEKQKAMAIVGIIIFFVCLVAFSLIKYALTISNQPEQRERVEVVGKKRNHEYESTLCTYIVVFRFSDGSEKEFKVNVASTVFFRSGSEEGRFYDSINVGDVGILTYKERKNIEKYIKKESNRWMGRQFISFEKDP